MRGPRLFCRMPLIAPVSEGQEVGFMRLTIDGKVVSRVPLITGGNVLRPPMWRKALDSVMFCFRRLACCLECELGNHRKVERGRQRDGVHERIIFRALSVVLRNS